MDIVLSVDGKSANTNAPLKDTENLNAIRAGGFVGFINDIEYVSKSHVMIDRLKMAGTVSVKKTDVNNSTDSVYLGGLVGECQGRGTIQNVNVSGAVKMDVLNNSGAMYINYICGGVIGKMRDGHLLNCGFAGRIDLPGSYNVASTTYVGGLVGTIGFLLEGEFKDDEDNEWRLSEQIKEEVTIENCIISGDLNLNHAGLGKINIGGICASAAGSFYSLKFLGSTYRHHSREVIKFKNCEYRGNLIKFERKNTGLASQNIGGFIADMIGGIELENCRSRTGLIEINVNANADDNSFNVGGFAGLLRGDLDFCYSNSVIDINFNGSGNLNAGGFFGNRQGNIIYPESFRDDCLISRSYSAGSITITAGSSDIVTVNAGGFIGNVQSVLADYYDIDDNYAQVDILVNRSGSGSGRINAGGFAGFNAGRIYRCFATGNVTVHSNEETTVYVGGITGYNNNILLQSVALNKYITLFGGDADDSRIGRLDSITGGRFAIESMVLAEGAYGSLTTTIPDTRKGFDGDTVTDSAVKLQHFWTADGGSGAGAGFTADIWNFAGIASRGYPLLRTGGNVVKGNMSWQVVR